jgi:hypothetical protein
MGFNWAFKGLILDLIFMETTQQETVSPFDIPTPDMLTSLIRLYSDDVQADPVICASYVRKILRRLLLFLGSRYVD